MKRVSFVIASMCFAWSFSSQARPIKTLDSISTTLTRITNGTGSSQANLSSKNLSFSDDGTLAVFESEATNLVSGGTQGGSNIYLYNVSTGAITLLSVGLGGVPANGASFEPMISGNGEYAVFSSYASNLVTGDTNGKTDVFIVNISTGVISLVSVSSSGTQGNDHSAEPSVSDDGSLVAFTSLATNLVTVGTGSFPNVFLRTVSTSTTTMVSVTSSGTQGDKGSYHPAISSNGSYVAFGSDATTLVSGTTNGCSNVLLSNLSSGELSLVSTSSSGVLGNLGSSNPAISSTGQYVAFQSRANNLISSDINGYEDVFLKDTSAGTTTLVSATTSGTQVTYDSVNPKISQDGRFIVFQSRSPDYVPWDTNHASDVFIHDMLTGITVPFSTLASQVVGNAKSFGAAISGGDGELGFVSLASNLVTPDTTNQYNIFIRSNPLVSQYLMISAVPSITDGAGAQNAFTVTRYGSLTSSLTLSYTTGGSATSGIDYASLPLTVTVPASASYAVIQVTPDNTNVAPTTTLSLTLPDSASYFVAASTATTDIINNNEFQVVVSASNPIFTRDGATQAQVTVTRSSGGTYGNLYVNLGITGTATLGLDYTGISTPIEIPAGQSSVTATLTGFERPMPEGDESVNIAIASGPGYTAGTSNEVYLTLHDPTNYTVWVAMTSAVAQKNNPSQTATYTIYRNGSTAFPLTVNYVMKGTAVSGVDYGALSGTATIASGQSSVNVVLTAIPDGGSSQVLTAQMELLDGQTYQVGSSRTAVAIITDTSSLPVVSVQTSASYPSATESGSQTGEFQISRTGVMSASLPVYFTYGGTAVEGTNYSASSTGSVTIPAGQISTTVTITGMSYPNPEPTLTTILAISAASGYYIDTVNSKATVNILDDINTPLIIAGTSIPLAYRSGKRNGLITLTRQGNLTSSLSVGVSLSGTAAQGTDYSTIGSSVTFPAGAAQVQVPIQAMSTPNYNYNGPEYMTLTVNSGSGYTIGSYPNGRVDIVDQSFGVISERLGLTGSSAPNADLQDISVSDSGQYVVFTTTATNLGAGATNGVSNVYYADVVNKTITMLVGLGGAQPNGGSFEPKISANGQYIVFSTLATNFTSDVLNGAKQVVLYNLSSGHSQIVSRGIYGIGQADSFQPFISYDGSYIAFASDASNLVMNDTNNKVDIFVYTRLTGTIVRANYSTSQFTSDSFKPSVSDDGTKVVFQSKEQIGGDTDSYFDVIESNLTTGTLSRVSQPIGGGTANTADSLDGYISGDGSTATFMSASTVLLSNLTNSANNVFTVNLATGTVALMSSNTRGAIATMPSHSPTLSTNARFGNFISSSRNLSQDFNCTTTAFVKDLLRGAAHAIDYQTALACMPPLKESYLSHDGRTIVSTIVSDSGVRDILMSSNPIFR